MLNEIMRGKRIPHLDGPIGAGTRRGARRPLRILVVDDDSDIRQLSTEVLIRSGYQVDAAEDGAAAWEALRIQAFHLLITDNEMPRLTGIGLVKKLRSARMALPVILATGSMLPDELARNPDLHLAAMLLKPFSTHELVETVTKVLHARKVARQEVQPAPDWQCQPSADGLRL